MQLTVSYVIMERLDAGMFRKVQLSYCHLSAELEIHVLACYMEGSSDPHFNADYKQT